MTKSCQCGKYITEGNTIWCPECQTFTHEVYLKKGKK